MEGWHKEECTKVCISVSAAQTTNSVAFRNSKNIPPQKKIKQASGIHPRTHKQQRSRAGDEDAAELAAGGSQQKVSRDKAAWLWLRVRKNLHNTTVQRGLIHTLHTQTHTHTHLFICTLQPPQQCTKTGNLDTGLECTAKFGIYFSVEYNKVCCRAANLLNLHTLTEPNQVQRAETGANQSKHSSVKSCTDTLKTTEIAFSA